MMGHRARNIWRALNIADKPKKEKRKRRHIKKVVIYVKNKIKPQPIN